MKFAPCSEIETSALRPVPGRARARRGRLWPHPPIGPRVPAAGRLARTASGLALVLTLFSSCGGPEGPGSTTDLNVLLTKVQTAPFFLQYHGVRQVEHTYEWAGDRQTIRYREEVWNAGPQQFAIDPLQVLSDVGMDPGQFLVLQARRAGFFRRYRDFHVRDLALFKANYQITDPGSLGEVAGRRTWDLSLARKGDSETAYDVRFDLDTGLVLEYAEMDLAKGTPRSRMWFEAIDLTPDFGGVIWFESSVNEVEVDLDSDLELESQLGFEPYKPKLAPPGYQYLSAARVTDPSGRNWLKVSFSDGVETLFFLHGDPQEPGTGPGSGPSGFGGPVGAGTSVGGATWRAGGETPSHALTFRAGPLTVMQADFGGADLIGVGKVDSHDLLVLLESSLP